MEVFDVVEVVEAGEGAEEDVLEEAEEEAQEDSDAGDDSNTVEKEDKSNDTYAAQCRRPRHIFRTRNTFNRNVEILIQ